MLRVLLLFSLPAVAVAVAAEPKPRVLVVAFQSLGVAPDVMDRVGDNFRAELSRKLWESVDSAETRRVLRAATMCGEEVECLATLGQRADARWVLAWGFGKVGPSYLVTALVVETTTGLKLSAFDEKLSSIPEEPAPLASRAIGALFQGVKRPVSAEVRSSPPPVIHGERRLLGPTLAMGAAALAGAITMGIFAGLAGSNYGRLQTAPVLDRPTLVTQQRTYNLVADLALGAALVSAAATVVLFVLGAPLETPAP